MMSFPVMMLVAQGRLKPPGALSLPHEQPQKDPGEWWQRALPHNSGCALVPQAFLCSSVTFAFTLG